MTEEETMKHLEERLRNNPKSLLFARLADIYIRRNRIDEAIDICSQGVQYHPYYLTGHYILGKAYDTKGDYENAEVEFKKVLSHDKHYLAAHKAIGDMMLAMGWEDKAALHYREILRIDPLDEEVRELLNSFTFDSGLSNDIDLQDQKGKMNFKPISKMKTEFGESKDWGEELEEIFTEEDKKSVSEESPASQDQVQDEFSAEERIVDSEHRTVSDTAIDDTISLDELKQDVAEESEKIEAESKEEELIFDISEKANETDRVEKASDTVSEPDTFSLDLPEVKGGKEEEGSSISPVVDSKSADEVESEVPDGSVKLHDEPKSDLGPVVEKESIKDEEIFSCDLGEEKIEKKEDVQEEDKEEEEEMKTPPSSDSAESEETVIEEPSLSSEKQLTEGEEEFSFDFQEDKVEDEDQESLSSAMEEEKEEKVKDSSLSVEEKPTLKKDEEVTKETKADFPTIKSEAAKPESDRSEKIAEPESIDKQKIDKPSKPAEREVVKEDSTAKSTDKVSGDKEQKIISPTLGEIYKAQGQYAKAIRIYETLLQKYPDEKKYQEEIDQLKQKLKD